MLSKTRLIEKHKDISGLEGDNYKLNSKFVNDLKDKIYCIYHHYRVVQDSVDYIDHSFKAKSPTEN